MRPGSGPARLGPLRPGNCLALLPLQSPGIAAMTGGAGRPGMSCGDSCPARPGPLRTGSGPARPGPLRPYNCTALLPLAPARAAAAAARAWLSAAAAAAARRRRRAGSAGACVGARSVGEGSLDGRVAQMRCERGHIALEGGLVALEGGNALSVESCGLRVTAAACMVRRVLARIGLPHMHGQRISRRK